jgi:hypothetical protein
MLKINNIILKKIKEKIDFKINKYKNNKTIII